LRAIVLGLFRLPGDLVVNLTRSPRRYLGRGNHDHGAIGVLDQLVGDTAEQQRLDAGQSREPSTITSAANQSAAARIARAGVVVWLHV
jgi:hypothetical protein